MGSCPSLSFIPALPGQAPASHRRSLEYPCRRLSPGPRWVPKCRPADPARRLRCCFSSPPPSHSLPPFPPRAAPGSEITALYIKKGQISALVKEQKPEQREQTRPPVSLGFGKLGQRGGSWCWDPVLPAAGGRRRCLRLFHITT